MLKRFLRSSSLPFAVISFALIVLAGTVVWTRHILRTAIREQIAGRDGEILYAVALMHQLGQDPGIGPLGAIEEPSEQFNLALNISRLKGVLGVRLFTPVGLFANALPPAADESRLAPADLAQLQSLKPVSHFHPAARLDEFFLQLPDAAAAPVPLLEVNVPLHSNDSRRLAGVVQFIIEGNSIATEFARLDRNLWWQSLAAFAGGGSVLVIALGWAFRRLAERTATLLRANQELALAAKTSAVGAVTSHLIHGLKNPLFGLQSFVSSHGHNTRGADDTEWQQAAAAAHRMQTMIASVVGVLHEEQGGAQYELELGEVIGIIAEKTRSVAESTGVPLTARVQAAGALSNRSANLITLVLVNLVENAMQASPPGKPVKLNVTATGGKILCEVRDEGPGLPDQIREHLFTPCQSFKAGGSGIGLAISKQLANHLGAELELRSSDARGSTFVLVLPAELVCTDARAASHAAT